MSVTMEDVRAALDPDEVDYPEASRLGPGALPHLMTLVQEAEPGLEGVAAQPQAQAARGAIRRVGKEASHRVACSCAWSRASR